MNRLREAQADCSLAVVACDSDSDSDYFCRSGTRRHTGNSITIGPSHTLQGLSMGLITGLQCDPGNAPRRLADPRKIHIEHPGRKARRPQAPRTLNSSGFRIEAGILTVLLAILQGILR